MAWFKSVHCVAGECHRCLDGAAISCICPHHKGDRMARFCDECGVKPASRKKHPRDVRLCVTCEREVKVDEHGTIIHSSRPAWAS